eukprot:TRINITY_DN16488_c0_g1_i2.p1 TRINITY_DN16488_c0_g1~~TRINITY_DN16488_c0_g1_i2.p1  ORF type:complete len:390 (+),score=40.92 TRINITY_DN16488_c0_g1_i2:129-1298(+)
MVSGRRELPTCLLATCALLFLGSCLAQNQSCPTTVTVNGVSKTYSTCVSYSSVSALSFSFDPSSLQLDAAFTNTPQKAYGWIAWGLSPDGNMPKSSVLIGWGDTSGGSPSVKPYYLPTYTTPQSGGILDVLDSSIEVSSDGSNITLAFTLQLNASQVSSYTIWATGGDVQTSTDSIPPHLDQNSGDVQIDFSSGQSVQDSGPADDQMLRNRHAVIATVSWGVMMPLGAFVARYVRPFLDPIWFYVHIATQLSAYLLGTAAFGLGCYFYTELTGQHWAHFYLAVFMMFGALLQILALGFRPNKKSPSRIYWNIYHHGVGYSTIIMGCANCFVGFVLLGTFGHWRKIYIIFLIVLGGASVIMEVVTWVYWFLTRVQDESDGKRLKQNTDDA